MNREIKFRGFVKELNQWVVGDLLSNNNQPIIVKQVERNYISTTDVGQGKHWAIETPAYKVVPESVGQFTGLTDKNGVEIYENDVLKRIASMRDYSDADGFQESIYAVKYFGIELLPFSETGVFMEEYEIIGNLFQNPELLKQ